MALNEWTHVTIVYTGTMLKIYLNGQFSNQTAYNVPFWTNDVPFQLGAGSFIGSLDELLIYDRALTDTEIQMLYQGGAYDGNRMSSTQLSVGEQWKAGYRTNYNDTSWTSDVNSSEITITS